MLSATLDLPTVFADVLEAMAFLAPAPPEAAMTCPENGVLVHMRFAGGGGGTIVLATALALGTAITDALLDAPESPAIQIRRSTDALKELLNVYTGELLRRSGVADPGLDLPIVEAIDDATWRTLVLAEGTTALDVDGIPVLLRISTGDRPCY